MFKSKDKIYIVSAARVYYDFFTGSRLKILCYDLASYKVRVLDVPVRKCCISAAPHDCILTKKFGLFTIIYLSPGVFANIDFYRGKQK